ncbi:MAG: twin-arginine translocase TatA/TatE family subunit [Thaumarchaeota archaeon]|nr:twin-arginine translocase TatA/TatE family subunit [Nitrososphaerota archaeon]
MAVSPLELLIIGAVVIVVIMWGPKKLPELARALGRAKKEFDSAAKEVQEVSKDLQSPIKEIAEDIEKESTAIRTDLRTESSSPSTSSKARQGGSKHDILTSTAKDIGITTEGKTRDEISRATVAEASKQSDRDDSHEGS